MAESFTKAIFDAVEAGVPPPPGRMHKVGWCETAETSAASTIAWGAREDARRFLRVNPRGETAWKTTKTVCANLRGVIGARLHTLKSTLLKRRDLFADNDQRGFCKHLEGTVGLGGRKARIEQFIMEEDGTPLRDKVHIREGWVGFFQTLLNKKSPKLNPTISALFPQRPLAPSRVEMNQQRMP